MSEMSTLVLLHIKMMNFSIGVISRIRFVRETAMVTTILVSRSGDMDCRQQIKLREILLPLPL